MQAQIILLFINVFSLSPTLCESVEFYVTPTPPPNIDCPPGQPCHTLDYYAQNTSLMSGQDNVSLLFLEGEHQLNNNITISNNHRLFLVGTANTTHIVIDSEKAFTIKNVSFFEMQDLHLRGIDLYDPRLSVLSSSHAAMTIQAHTVHINTLQFDNFEIDLEAEEIEVKQSSINATRLNANCTQLYRKHTTPVISISIRSSILTGTQVIVFSSENFSKFKANLNVTECSVTASTCNRFCSDDILVAILYKGALLHITLKDTIYTGKIPITTDVDNLVILSVQNCQLTGLSNANKLFDDNSAIIEINTRTTTNHPANNSVLVYMRDSIARGNDWKAIDVSVPYYSNNRVNITIVNTTLTANNQVIVGRKSREIISNVQDPESIVAFVYVKLKNVTIYDSLSHSLLPVVLVQNINRLVLDDCRFTNNSGTAVETYFSDVTLSGNNSFANNTGTKGGAIGLHNSYMILSDGVNVTFIGNHAQEVGGAVYVYMSQEYQLEQCFYKISAANCYCIKEFNNVDIRFHNNTAVNGGNDLYGGRLYSRCKYYWNPLSKTYFPNPKHTLFHISNGSSLSSVTCDPARVCLCDEQGIPRCADIDYIYRELPPRYPGELFTVSAVVVGCGFGTVRGLVYSKIVQTDYSFSLEDNQRIQNVLSLTKCTPLHFSVESTSTSISATISLTVSLQRVPIQLPSRYSLEKYIKEFMEYTRIKDELLYHPVFLNIHLKDCPVGFNLTTSPPYICTCHPKLEENGISVCVITNHTGWVYRSGTIWVSASFTENETNSFVVHPYCPYDFCKQGNISVDLRFPEKQCQFNHSGIMCGGCYSSLSLALGSSRCLPCDNRYVSLLLVFILAGLTLVFFMKVLDLTVAKGTINGLIFYANIVWANKSILFPTTETLHPVQQILQTFIAWLNLDLGIETCFIDGLDAYWKTWLQFVFPIYVWSITGVVIIASRYSTRASKIFGNNSVPVLATLILLSYAKLLRTIITVLGFSLLNYEQGTKIVWSFDGNVPYFGAAHTILFLVAIAALLLLWLPYTTVLLTLQWLRRKSYLKPLRWINRWKPFFDAYFGQLKPKHHHWVGVLLLVRVFLLILFAVTSAIVPRLNIVVIAFVGVFLFIHFAVRGMVYKLRSLSILEGSFILNLTSLAILKLYVHQNSIANSAVIYTSVGIVFVEFVVIVIYHTYSRIKSTYVAYKRRHTDNTDNVDRELRVIPPDPHNQMHYREPLLDSLAQ